jgi:hypothetical protein
MIENQIYNLLIIQTLGPLITDVIKKLIGEHESLMIEWININSIMIILTVYYLWKYKYAIKSFSRNIINRKNAIYKLEGTIHYADKEILKHNSDNMKNINCIVHYIINVIKPAFKTKTMFNIKTENPSGIKIYRVPEHCTFNFKGNEYELIYRDNRDNTSQTIILIIKGYSYDIIDDLITSSYKYHKDTVDDIDKEQYRDCIYLPRNLNTGRSYIAYNQYICKNNESFDDLFINEKDKLMKHLNDFKNGISKHKFLSLLLHGKPGTGKSSIIKMMANYFNRSIVYIKLNEIRKLSTLIEIIHANIYEVETGYDSSKDVKVGNNKIIVFEDIDACCEDLIKKRNVLDNCNNNTNKERRSRYNHPMLDDIAENTFTFDDLLNVFNGVIPNNGLIFAMSTNYIDKIDNALIRPGRITLNLELNEINKQSICSMIHKYYTDISIEQINSDVVLNEVIPCILENIIKNTSSYTELLSIINNENTIDDYNTKYNN